jgi:hypothetical protein
LCFEQFPQLLSERENSPFIILRGSWIKQDSAAPKINLPPFERESLALSAPGDTVKGH